MANVRTPKGDPVATKISGTTLTISNVTIPVGSCLVVGIGCDNSQGIPISVKHNNRDLKPRRSEDNTTDNLIGSSWLKGQYHKVQTGDIVATWAAAIGKRVMIAVSWDSTRSQDSASSNSEIVSTTSPNTNRSGINIDAGDFVIDEWYEIITLGTTNFQAIGAASNTVGITFQATGIGAGTGTGRRGMSRIDDIAIAFFVAGSVVANHAGAVAEWNDGTGYLTANLGVKAGTTGGPPANNVTIIEAWQELDSHLPIRMRLTGATSRKWANVLTVLEIKDERGTYTEIDWLLDLANSDVVLEEGVVYVFPYATGVVPVSDTHQVDVPVSGTPIITTYADGSDRDAKVATLANSALTSGLTSVYRTAPYFDGTSQTALRFTRFTDVEIAVLTILHVWGDTAVLNTGTGNPDWYLVTNKNNGQEYGPGVPDTLTDWVFGKLGMQRTIEELDTLGYQPGLIEGSQFVKYFTWIDYAGEVLVGHPIPADINNDPLLGKGAALAALVLLDAPAP